MTYVFKYIWFGCPWPCDGLNDRQKRQLLANLENALFPQMLNFLMCTINHKSPNISIQYCLPTCLVGFLLRAKSWQPNERSALIGWSCPKFSVRPITEQLSAVFSIVAARLGREKNENSMERILLLQTRSKSIEFKGWSGVHLRSI